MDKKIRCNNCYTIYNETEDHQVVECLKCKTGAYLTDSFSEEEEEV